MRVNFKKWASGLVALFIPILAHAGLNTDREASLTPEPSAFITADHAQAIYKNLVEKHWVPDTGLFISFLGTGDNKLVQQGSTYEQAAMGILALRMNDMERAKGVLDFLKYAWQEEPMKAGREGHSGLANFYNAEFGSDGIEKTVHVGPNAWAGLFIAMYANRTGDKEAAAVALDMARWITKDVPHKNGGVAMGDVYGLDDVPWPKVFSTENNISHYAFLNELLRSKTLDPNDRAWMAEEKKNVEDWIVKVGFDRLAYAMNRGTNPQGMDRTRALDTITWLISAMGPQHLKARGIDPDRLMRQAKESFVVKVKGLSGVDATDRPEADLTFALAADDMGPGRGTQRISEDGHRMIWYEGLGQYINTLNIMAAYSQDAGRTQKALYYTQQAQKFTEQFDKAALTTFPKGAAYAYATSGKFFHDGWFPPADAVDGPPSSLIAGVWRCFAGLGYDPLAGQDIPGVASVPVVMPAIAKVKRSPPAILYGTSEEMVVKAWQQLDAGDADRAIQQAQATIQEWSSWARKLQQKKVAKVGHAIDYSGTPEQRKAIFSYWALNDVGAAYFILGKAFDQKRHYPQAASAFRQIMQNYSLAQVWDPRGWFWTPVEAVADEYASNDPRHYGSIAPQVLAATPAIGKQPN